MPGTWGGAGEYWHWDAGRPEGLFFYVCRSSGAAALRTEENKVFWRRDSTQKLFEKSLRKPLDIIKMKWYIVITLKKG